VAILEMHGKGTFFDPRLDDAATFPIAAREGFGHIRNSPDLVTSKLAALQFYQLAIPAPPPPEGSFDAAAAERGDALFEGRARCATCHVAPLYTEPGWNMHTPAEIGIDDFQANRSPDKRYRTSPLAGLWTHQEGGFYHDGRFSTLSEVVDHYNGFMHLGLSTDDRDDLVEYLKSLPNDEVSEGSGDMMDTVWPRAHTAIFDRARLTPPSPNPASGQVVMIISLPKAGDVDLSVFDVSGRRVQSLFQGEHSQGQYSVTWDLGNAERGRVVPGVYFYRLAVDGVAQAEQRIVVNR
jgi:hypothetical protein